VANTTNATGSIYTRLEGSAGSAAAALNSLAGYANTKLTNVTETRINVYLPNVVGTNYINQQNASVNAYHAFYFQVGFSGGVWVNNVNAAQIQANINSKYTGRNTMLSEFYAINNEAWRVQYYTSSYGNVTFYANNYWVSYATTPVHNLA
jgi:hypothetical protein